VVNPLLESAVYEIGVCKFVQTKDLASVVTGKALGAVASTIMD
jgi:hypothetical protein